MNLYPCVVASQIDSGLGNVTSYGHWDISKCDTSRGSESACALSLGLSSCGIQLLCEEAGASLLDEHGPLASNILTTHQKGE